MASVTILGDGGWGTAFALTALNQKHNVTIWGAFPEYIEEVRNTRINKKYLDGITIPPEINYETDILKAVQDADLIVNAAPAQWVRSVFEKLRDKGFKGGYIVSLTKGLENESFKRPSEIITELIMPDAVAAVSGPSHAEEVAKKLPASVVAASTDIEFAERVQEAFSSEYFRIYSDDDIIGVEIAGALKNVIAIAGGMCDGLELGDNAKSALVARGIVEISRLGVHVGAQPATFYGLSGIGDLITTCYSGFGRNRSVGVRVSRGETIQDILDNMEQVAEGVWTVKSVVPFAEKLGISMPISKEVYNILFNGKPPMEAVQALMSRNYKQEKEEWVD
ncbi:NAD(P)H-dependent glycerol-3-phosphate dehydrogenase [Planctomycetota bacterium]